MMKIPDIAIGAITGALITAIAGFLAIWVKDYLIPQINYKRQQKDSRKEAFKKYANPIVFSSISLLYRIREIFHRGSILLSKSPKTDFYEYKLISSLYRLCALIGWIRAANIENSFVEVEKDEEFEKVKMAINNFESSLADGQHIENAVLDEILQILNININERRKSKEVIAIKLENHLNHFCFDQKVEIAKQLPLDLQQKLVIDISIMVCKEFECEEIDNEIIKKHTSTIIQEMSRIEAFLYRDWQSAIGDYMIEKANKDSMRKFEVIGYKEFESRYFSNNDEDKKWMARIAKLFCNLDTQSDNPFDERISQFKKLYAATYQILIAFSAIKANNIDISKDSVERLKTLE